HTAPDVARVIGGIACCGSVGVAGLAVVAGANEAIDVLGTKGGIVAHHRPGALPVLVGELEPAPVLIAGLAIPGTSRTDRLIGGSAAFGTLHPVGLNHR